MDEPPIDLDPLASRIEEALILRGMSATAFGYLYFGDPAFVTKMRRGRQFRRRMIDRIETVLKEMDL